MCCMLNIKKEKLPYKYGMYILSFEQDWLATETSIIV